MVDTASNPRLSLCWGSMEGLGLSALAGSAAAAGFDAITLNAPLYEDARRAGMSDSDIARLLDDHGLAVSGVDPLFNWLPGAVQLPGDDPMSRLTQASMEEVFHIAQVVGTDIVNAPLGFTTPDSQQQLIDSFGGLCDAAASAGLRVSLEFMPFTAVSDLDAAIQVVTAAGCLNGGIMFDCWHHHRSGGSPGDVLEIPPGKVFALQLDDALPEPMPDIIEETLNHRLLPGEGCIALGATLENLLSTGQSFVIDVEVFDDFLRQKPDDERARLLYESARRVVEALPA